MTAEEFKDAMRSICARDTSADPAGWSEDNPMWGHCAVVSLLAQEQFGGTLLRQSLAGVAGLEHVRSHYFNRLADGTEVDFTVDQFRDHLPPHLSVEERSRERILVHPDTQKRYLLLKARFES